MCIESRQTVLSLFANPFTPSVEHASQQPSPRFGPARKVHAQQKGDVGRPATFRHVWHLFLSSESIILIS